MPRHGFPPSAEVPTTGARETRRSCYVTKRQEFGIVGAGAHARAVFCNKHTQRQSVMVLEAMIRNGTADSRLCHDLRLLRRELEDAQAAAAAQRVSDRLLDVKLEGAHG